MVRSCQAKEIFLQIWPSNDHTEKYSANSLYTEQSWMVRLCKVSWLQTLDYGYESTKVVYMAQRSSGQLVDPIGRGVTGPTEDFDSLLGKKSTRWSPLLMQV